MTPAEEKKSLLEGILSLYQKESSLETKLFLEKLYSVVSRMEVRCGAFSSYENSIGGVLIDPCKYDEVETVENAIVHILRCSECGHEEVSWERNYAYDDDLK